MMKSKKNRALLVMLFAICCCMQTSLLAGNSNGIGKFVIEYAPAVVGVMVGSRSVIIEKSGMKDDASKLLFRLIVMSISVFVWHSMKNELKKSKKKISYFLECVVGIGVGLATVDMCLAIRSVVSIAFYH